MGRSVIAYNDTGEAIMNARDVRFFRRLLTQRMDDLRAGVSKTVEGMDDDGHFPDPTDRAALETDRNFTLRIRDRERKLIGKIEEALRRLDEGVYGVCEVCGGKISKERLKARPVTTLCIDCKSDQEVEEKRSRRLV
jgi:DnaK suppressor protein